MTDVTIRPIRSTDEQALAQILESLPGSFTDFGQEAVLADAKNAIFNNWWTSWNVNVLSEVASSVSKGNQELLNLFRPEMRTK